MLLWVSKKELHALVYMMLWVNHQPTHIREGMGDATTAVPLAAVLCRAVYHKEHLPLTWAGSTSPLPQLHPQVFASMVVAAEHSSMGCSDLCSESTRGWKQSLLLWAASLTCALQRLPTSRSVQTGERWPKACLWSHPQATRKLNFATLPSPSSCLSLKNRERKAYTQSPARAMHRPFGLSQFPLCPGLSGCTCSQQ